MTTKDTKPKRFIRRLLSSPIFQLSVMFYAAWFAITSIFIGLHIGVLGWSLLYILVIFFGLPTLAIALLILSIPFLMASWLLKIITNWAYKPVRG